MSMLKVIEVLAELNQSWEDDGVTGIPQEVGKADLMRLGMVHLRAQPVADPDFWLRAFEEPVHNRLAAAGRDAVRTAVAEPNTYCQQVCPSTRADVSSEAITGEARTSASIRSASAANGACARLNMLAMAPSLISSRTTP